MPYFDPSEAPPPYNDLDDANREIRRLQKYVFEHNIRLAKIVEKAELTKRSLKGTIKALEAQIRALKGENEPEDPSVVPPRRPSSGGGWSL